MAEFEDKLNSILGNQEAMSQIMSLARSLSGENETSPAPEEPAENTDLSAMLGQLDPKMLQLGMEVLGQVRSTEDRNAALLSALRPFLKEDRQARLDRALQIARMARAVRVALNVLGGKEGELV